MNTPVLDLLSDPNRWTKGSFYRYRKDGTTCYCLLGAAIESTPPGTTERKTLLNKLATTINKLYPLPRPFTVPELRIIEFNDNPTTTHEMVLEVLKEAQV